MLDSLATIKAEMDAKFNFARNTRNRVSCIKSGVYLNRIQQCNEKIAEWTKARDKAVEEYKEVSGNSVKYLAMAERAELEGKALQWLLHHPSLRKTFKGRRVSVRFITQLLKDFLSGDESRIEEACQRFARL